MTTTLTIGSLIADKTIDNLWQVHNEGRVSAINESYIIFKSFWDGLFYATPIDRFTLIDEYGNPIK